MHHIYKTEAIVLGSIPLGDANKRIYLLSLDLGLISARAQGVRKMESKLRYALQDFSLSQVALVRGRGGWKITSAIPEANYFNLLKISPRALFTVTKIVSLLQSLIVGEETNKEIFKSTKSAIKFLSLTGISEKDILNAECITVLRILYFLGYFNPSEKFKDFCLSTDLPISTLKKMDFYHKEVIEIINTSLKESQLT